MSSAARAGKERTMLLKFGCFFLGVLLTLFVGFLLPLRYVMSEGQKEVIDAMRLNKGCIVITVGYGELPERHKSQGNSSLCNDVMWSLGKGAWQEYVTVTYADPNDAVQKRKELLEVLGNERTPEKFKD